MRVSTRGDYASRALLSLALRTDEVGPRSVREIAERTALPQPYLEQILLALKGAGLVVSKRGVGGGYELARLPEQILLTEIIRAVDGPIVAGDFDEPHTGGACDHEGQPENQYDSSQQAVQQHSLSPLGVEIFQRRAQTIPSEVWPAAVVYTITRRGRLP